MTDPVVQTPYGPVLGAVTEHGAVFRAVPYAAPPVGELRFQPPAPVAPWTEVRDAREAGATAPQSGESSELLPNVVIAGDDYLHVNVWTPDVSGSAPVLVFIHGGAFVTGSNALSGYDGSAFARDGVVIVVINYRLGANGFLWFGEGVANLGLLDQVAALKWVRDSIAAFGGDPAAVTVMGESAGAMSVGALMTMPSAQGLFDRAIMESGAGHHAITPAGALTVGRRLAKALGVAPTREAVATASTDALIAAQAAVSAQLGKSPFRRTWGDVATNLMPFEPVIDGEVLPELPIRAMENGAGRDIDVLVGYNTQEGRLFFIELPENGWKTRLTTFVMSRLFGLGRKDRAAYRAWMASDYEVLVALLTDAVYRIPAINLAEAHGRAHVYRFSWESPAYDGRLGASHAMELPYVFDNLADSNWAGLLGGPGSQEVATRMHATWVAFVKTGDPGWPSYVDGRVEQEFGGDGKLVADVHPESRALWAGRR
ncbi:carboxylesterase/lipase family protein [Kribbella antibiotica]|uniref:Carboxylic ester hydrolase n=1 Tax=Kribbella antibiotica TaxID=190195 RepID=A0A4R4ZVK0_9ACTN|nr:carboxylesterase family protein [Kribbella antibiotica]TDD63203.1 carboxylesterase/lipase family protein [Kribbella antibiotica]